MDIELSQKDLAPVAEQFLTGNKAQAASLLVGVLTTALTGSPILGGAAAGTILVLATRLSNSAMRRAEAAGQKLDDEWACVVALQGAVSKLS